VAPRFASAFHVIAKLATIVCPDWPLLACCDGQVMGLVAVLGIETICWLIPTTADGGPDASSKQAKKR